MGKNTKEYNAQYYQEHRNHLLELISKKHVCECGAIITASHLSRHKIKKLHEQLMLAKQGHVDKQITVSTN